MAKSKSRSRKTKSKSPHKFLLKKGSKCPTGYLHIKQVKKNSKKYFERKLKSSKNLK